MMVQHSQAWKGADCTIVRKCLDWGIVVGAGSSLSIEEISSSSCARFSPIELSLSSYCIELLSHFLQSVAISIKVVGDKLIM